MENKNYQTGNGFSGHINNFQNDLLLFNPEQGGITEGDTKIWHRRKPGNYFSFGLKIKIAKLSEEQPVTLFY